MGPIDIKKKDDFCITQPNLGPTLKKSSFGEAFLMAYTCAKAKKDKRAMRYKSSGAEQAPATATKRQEPRKRKQHTLQKELSFSQKIQKRTHRLFRHRGHVLSFASIVGFVPKNSPVKLGIFNSSFMVRQRFEGF